MKIPRFTNVQKIITRSFFKENKFVFIYTEDKKSDQIFYELLLKRLQNEKITIAKIEPLGPKATVITRSLQDKKPQRPTLYIIDGDIDLLTKDPIESNNLIGLDRYCIENFLCCEAGILSLLQTNLGRSTEYYRPKLDFENMISSFGKHLLKIAIRYSVAQNLQCSTKYKKSTDFFFIRAGVFRIDKTLISNEIKRVESLIIYKLKENGVRSFRSELVNRIKEVEMRNAFSFETYLKVLSGKDMILPIIETKIKRIDGSFKNWQTDQIKRHLAERVDVSNLDRIRQKIQQLI